MQHTEPGADSASQRLYAYTVREFDTADGKKGRAWTRIGVAFPHKDGTGFNVEVQSFPLDGRIALFPADSEGTSPLERGISRRLPEYQRPACTSERA